MGEKCKGKGVIMEHRQEKGGDADRHCLHCGIRSTHLESNHELIKYTRQMMYTSKCTKSTTDYCDLQICHVLLIKHDIFSQMVLWHFSNRYYFIELFDPLL